LFILCGRSTAEAPNDEIHDNGKNDEKRDRQQSVHVQIKVAWPHCVPFSSSPNKPQDNLHNWRSHMFLIGATKSPNEEKCEQREQ